MNKRLMRMDDAGLKIYFQSQDTKHIIYLELNIKENVIKLNCVTADISIFGAMQ